MTAFIVRLLAGLCEFDQLIRVHQLGFVAVWPLLGRAAAGGWTPRTFLGLLAASLLFNTFGALHNDSVHLYVDRHDPHKSRKWLVRGKITPGQAAQLAFMQIPLAVLVHLVVGFSAASLPLLLGAFAGQGVYNVYGKRCPIPLLPEVAEAVAACLLVVYGATAAGGTVTDLVWLSAAAAASFIFIVNAFHGGLRDIEVELALHQRITPIWLGCRGVVGGVVHISPLMSAYIGGWQVTMIAVSLAAARIIGQQTGHLLSVPLVVIASGISAALLIVLHSIRKPAWDVLMRVHLGMVVSPIMAAFVPALGAAGGLLLVAVYLCPGLVLTLAWVLRLANRRVSANQVALVSSV